MRRSIKSRIHKAVSWYVFDVKSGDLVLEYGAANGPVPSIKEGAYSDEKKYLHTTDKEWKPKSWLGKIFS